MKLLRQLKLLPQVDNVHSLLALFGEWSSCEGRPAGRPSPQWARIRNISVYYNMLRYVIFVYICEDALYTYIYIDLRGEGTKACLWLRECS